MDINIDLQKEWEKVFQELKQAWIDANQNKVDFRNFISNVLLVPESNLQAMLIINLSIDKKDFRQNGQIIIHLTRLPGPTIGVDEAEFALPFLTSNVLPIQNKEEIGFLIEITQNYFVPYFLNSVQARQDNSEEIM